ncbi:MAG: ion channel [Bacteroidia bacterium]
MKILNLTLQHLVIILLGVIVFFIDDKELFRAVTTKIILVAIVLFKFFYFLSHNLKLIRGSQSDKNYFQKFLVSISVNISLIVVSFGVDYFCLYQIDSFAFNGVPAVAPLYEKICTLIYFSISTFSTTGFGDIQALTLTGRFLISLEIIMAFITTVFIISNFVNLKSISTNN